MAEIEEVRVGGRQWFALSAGCLSSDAICHTHRASGAVVVAGTEAPCFGADRGVDRGRFEEAKLCQVQSGVVFVGANNPYQMVQDLSQPDGG
jgi:hypothetical protein